MTVQSTGSSPWHLTSPDEAARRLQVDPALGLTAAEADRRRAEHGPNALPTEPVPSTWSMARGQLTNPMNIMLAIVAVASFAIGQVPTGLVVTCLVLFNVVMGTSQEKKARASVDALARLQVPQARLRRDGEIAEIDSTGLVPGIAGRVDINVFAGSKQAWAGWLAARAQ